MSVSSSKRFKAFLAWSFASLDVRSLKGQALLCEWQERLPCSYVSYGHVSVCAREELCYLGSTYERNFASDAPEWDQAALLKERVAPFYAGVGSLREREMRAKTGARLVTRDDVEELGLRGALRLLFGGGLRHPLHQS